MNAIAGQAAGKDYLSLAGPGFRDFSRIAASDPKVWRDIFMTNRDELLLQSRAFQNQLSAFEALMSSGNAQGLEDQIARASAARSQWRMNQLD